MYAGFWIRFLASILDSIILTIPVYILDVFAVLVGLDVLVYVFQLLPLIVLIYMEGTMGGGPGKLMLHLNIVGEDGGFIGIPGAILRQLGKFLAAIPFGLGLFWIGWDKEKQGWHDKIAKTHVLRV